MFIYAICCYVADKKSSWRAIIFQKKNSGPSGDSDHEDPPSDGIGREP